MRALVLVPFLLFLATQGAAPPAQTLQFDVGAFLAGHPAPSVAPALAASSLDAPQNSREAVGSGGAYSGLTPAEGSREQLASSRWSTLELPLSRPESARFRPEQPRAPPDGSPPS